MQSFKLRFGVEVSDGDLADIICNGLECGGYASFAINHFVPRKVEDLDESKIPQWVKDRNDVPYRHLWMGLIEDHSMFLCECHDDDNPAHELTREKMVAGVRKFFAKFPHRYDDATYDGQIDPGALDAIDSDAILQLALLGEVVYG